MSHETPASDTAPHSGAAPRGFACAEAFELPD